MSVDASLIQRSLDLALERNPKLVTDFYGILFRRHPSVRWMFQRSLRNVQERMFEQALLSIVSNVDDGAWLRKTLGALGAQHVGYGVTNEMYDWMREALLVVLADALANDWTAELESAWTDAYDMVAGAMRA
jgi:hemoglobin-like flavoprotein